MRKMVLNAPKPVTEAPLCMEEMPDRAPGADEIALAVSACAVCRTDLQLVTGDLAPRSLPIVPGHQVVGRVVDVGAGAREWALGDRAAVGWLGWACGRCAFCMEGKENLCERARFTGWDFDGGYASRVIVKARFALRVPDGFEEIETAPLLCGGVIGYRALKRAGVRAGDRVGLYGFGASAFLAMQIALHWGCEVFVATRSEHERERALEMGAAWAGGYDDRPPAPLSASVTFAPVGDVVVAALRATARGGAVAINAIHLDRIPSFPYELLWWERSVLSVANYTREDARELLTLAADIPIRTRIERYPLAAANEALALLKEGRGEGTAVLVP